MAVWAVVRAALTVSLARVRVPTCAAFLEPARVRGNRPSEFGGSVGAVGLVAAPGHPVPNAAPPLLRSFACRFSSFGGQTRRLEAWRRRYATEDSLRRADGVCTNGAFPNADDHPSRSLSQRGGSCVALSISLHLVFPEFRVRAAEGHLPSMYGARVPVVAVDEDGDTVTREDEIWGTSAADCSVETKPGAESVQCPSEVDLRLGVDASSSSQVSTGFGWDPSCHEAIVPSAPDRRVSRWGSRVLSV